MEQERYEKSKKDKKKLPKINAANVRVAEIIESDSPGLKRTLNAN